MKTTIFLLLIGFSTTIYAQEGETEPKTIEGYELGIDLSISASNLGGTYGFGPKFGFRFNENLILGPSFRYQKSWSSNYGAKYSYNIYGGGMFLHGRYKNVIFGGFEFEMLNSPINYTTISPGKNWIPTLFVCAGFSKEWNHIVRLNVGMYYDVIDNANSPFRQGYFMKITNPTTGQVTKLVPLIYRISFFFPLDRPNKKKDPEIEEENSEEEYIEE